MPVTAWLLLGGAIVLEVLGTLTLSALSVEADRSPTRRVTLLAAVALLYTASFAALWGVLGLGLGLNVAYGIWAASGVALTALSSAVVFKERITGTMAGGIALIAAGVAMVEAGS